MLFYNKLYIMPLHVSSTCAHHQEFKIVLYSLWYHHTSYKTWAELSSSALHLLHKGLVVSPVKKKASQGAMSNEEANNNPGMYPVKGL